MSFVRDFLRSGAIFSSSPHTVFIAWGLRQWSASPLETSLPGYYFPDFFLKSATPWCHHPFSCEINILELLKQLKKEFLLEKNYPLRWQPASLENFKRSFFKLKQQLASGQLKKGVPYIFEISQDTFKPAKLKSTLISLLETIASNPLYAYGFWDEHEGMLGATPEILFESNDGHRLVKTMACAGTESTIGQNFPHSLYEPKEQHEHKLVIEGLKSSLMTLGAKVDVEKTSLLELPLLTHLMTPLTAEFTSQLNFEKIVTALHPTPALGAFPRTTGLQWLLDEEKKLPRFRFGAPAGILYPGGQRSFCAVAIRNIQWKKNWSAIGAGCGVVEGSFLEKEWGELHLKINSIKQTLNL